MMICINNPKLIKMIIHFSNSRLLHRKLSLNLWSSIKIQNLNCKRVKRVGIIREDCWDLRLQRHSLHFNTNSVIDNLNSISIPSQKLQIIIELLLFFNKWISREIGCLKSILHITQLCFHRIHRCLNLHVQPRASFLQPPKSQKIKNVNVPSAKDLLTIHQLPNLPPTTHFQQTN